MWCDFQLVVRACGAGPVVNPASAIATTQPLTRPHCFPVSPHPLPLTHCPLPLTPCIVALFPCRVSCCVQVWNLEPGKSGLAADTWQIVDQVRADGGGWWGWQTAGVAVGCRARRSAVLSSVVTCHSRVVALAHHSQLAGARSRTNGGVCVRSWNCGPWVVGTGARSGRGGGVRAPLEMGRRAEPANLDALRRRDSGVGAPVGTGGVGTSGQATRKLPKCEAQRAEDRFINAGTNECI